MNRNGDGKDQNCDCAMGQLTMRAAYGAFALTLMLDLGLIA